MRSSISTLVASSYDRLSIHSTLCTWAFFTDTMVYDNLVRNIANIYRDYLPGWLFVMYRAMPWVFPALHMVSQPMKAVLGMTVWNVNSCVASYSSAETG